MKSIRHLLLTIAVFSTGNLLFAAEAKKILPQTSPPPILPAVAQPSFDPKGKSEEELIAKWGQPKGRMDLGDETQLIFSQGTVTLKNNVVETFVPQVQPKGSKAAEAKSTARTSSKATAATPDDEARLYLKRLQDDLSDKRKELSEQREKMNKEVAEVDKRYQDTLNRASRDYYAGSSGYSGYGSRSQNARDDRDREVKGLEERFGIARLNEEIKQLEEDIRNQYEKINR